MLELRNITKTFSGIRAVQNVCFSAYPGEVTGYLGPNGSGKSTTIKLIAGLIEPSEGTILYKGIRIEDDLIAHKMRLGYVPEEQHLYTHLSGGEFLEMTGQLRGLPEKPLAEKIAGLLHLLGLYEDRFVPLSSYSKGMRQKILLAAALLHNPEVLILDEPFTGLDVTSVLILRTLVQELARRGKVVLFSTHELDIAERICSRIIILHKGCIVADDSIERLRELMAAPTLEEIFSQLAVDRDSLAVSREIAGLIEL